MSKFHSFFKNLNFRRLKFFLIVINKTYIQNQVVMFHILCINTKYIYNIIPCICINLFSKCLTMIIILFIDTTRKNLKKIKNVYIS